MQQCRSQPGVPGTGTTPFKARGLRHRADKAQTSLVEWAASADAHILESWLLVRSQAGSTAPDTRRPQRVGFLGSFQNLCSWTVVSEVERNSDQV